MLPLHIDDTAELLITGVFVAVSAKWTVSLRIMIHNPFKITCFMDYTDISSMTCHHRKLHWNW